MSKNKTEKACSKCLTDKKIVDGYYLSANDVINKDNRLPICKDCLRSLVDMSDVDSLINVMRMVDRPFHKKTYDDALLKSNAFGYYMRMLGSPQMKYWTYLDSSFEGHFEEMIAKDSKELDKTSTIEGTINFKVTPKLLLKWGNYSESEIYQLEQFYVDMEGANSVNTPQHREQLKLLCKLNFEQNKALGGGKVNDFKNLNTQYNKILENSGFRPIDKLSGGEAVGIRTFSQIWEEIEKDGFIPKHDVSTTQDIVDKTIMYLGNYTHKLLNAQTMSAPPSDTPEVDDLDES